MTELFNIIEADPPHFYNSRSNTDRFRGGALRHYGTMKDADLDGLGETIRQLAAPHALLYYWTTGPKHHDSIQTIRAWGFEPKTYAFTWIKTNAGKGHCWQKLYEMHEARALQEPGIKEYLQGDPTWAQSGYFFGNGFYSKANAEICILAKRGSGMKPARDDVSSVIVAPIRAHSQKPWEAHYRIEAMYPQTRKLELFARRQSAGWTCLGNEMDGMDIRESLPLLHRLHQAGATWDDYLKGTPPF